MTPVAWIVELPGARPESCGIVPATTRGKARAYVYREARDLGYDVTITSFRAIRCPELDEWAATARLGHWTPSAVPGGEEAVRAHP